MGPHIHLQVEEVSVYDVAWGEPRLWAKSQLGCFTLVLFLERTYSLRDIR